METMLPGIYFVEYNDLTVDTFDEGVLDKVGYCVRYAFPNGGGHYISITKNALGEVDFYNSLGLDLDIQAEGVMYHLNDIRTALVNRGVVCNVNRKNIQQKKLDVATCGRYVLLRLMYSRIDNLTFNNNLLQLKRMNKNLSYDDVAVLLTFLL